MEQIHRDQYLKAAQAALQSKAASREILKKAGIVDDQGRLTPPYAALSTQSK